MEMYFVERKKDDLLNDFLNGEGFPNSSVVKESACIQIKLSNVHFSFF